EIFLTCALPRTATALRTLERNFTPSKVATTPPDRSRKRKLPPSTLSRRISGTNDLLALLRARAEGPALSLEPVGAVSGAGPGPAGSDTTAAGVGVTAALVVWPADTCFRSSAFSDKPGNLHFPSAFCGQITLGSTRD